ncbi:retrotransposable element [Pimephales promelas]|nr:retrotransposable element [Pimephales promelas]
MKTKVEAEIERLLKEKIIEPVKHSEWAAPVVPVLKSDNTVRLCGDYKLTVNRVSKLEQYPIPRIDYLFATLSGGQKFTNLDMSHAYHQIALDAESKKYVTVNTHKGLFTYRVLPFGVSSSPAIFQRTIEGVLQGIPYVAVFLDDILVTGRNDEEHLQTLARVLRRLQEAGLRLKRSKCSFMERRAPVHKLLRKDEKWNWEGEQEAAFAQSKEMINSVQVLLHYDPQKDVILSCDASPYGLGAVLSHKMPDGSERPIGFMSRTLNQAERNYSQLDKEGSAIMFGLQRFHKYLYGRKFTIVTDHKPLLSLFNELKAVPQMSSPRIQRWAVTLRAYEYIIIYKPVLVRNFSYGPKWIPGNIETVTGPVSYKVMLGDGRVVRRHVDQIHGRQELLVKHSREEMDGKSPDYDFFDNSATVSFKETETTGAEDIQGEVDPFEVSEDSSQAAEIITEMDKSVSPVVIMRRSQRTRKLPGYLKDYEIS